MQRKKDNRKYVGSRLEKKTTSISNSVTVFQLQYNLQ